MRPIRPINDRLLASVQGGVANPTAPAGDTYKDPKLTLFGKDGKATGSDIKQGKLQDCWLEATAAALADRKGGKGIKQLVQKNKDGTYTVSLFEKSAKGKLVKKAVTVDGQVPFMANGQRRGNRSDAAWPGLVEKAVAQQQGNTYDGTAHKSLTKGGQSRLAMEMLTGKRAMDHNPRNLTVSAIDKDLKEGIATIWTAAAPTDTRLAKKHVYQVKSVDLKNKSVTLHNPWANKPDIVLKESELRDKRNFAGYTEVDLD